MRIEAIDLFCGAGGLTYGLIQAGVTVKAGFDNDSRCQYPYEANNNGAKFHHADVAQLAAADLKKHWSKGAIRLLAGCAPCQPFSTAANATRPDEDPRYPLLEHFSRLVEEAKPELVTMENVPRVKNHKPFQDFVATLERLGYAVWFKSVSCMDFGVPQTRRRMVLLASKLGSCPTTLIKPDLKSKLTVAEALKGVSTLEAGAFDPADPIHVSRGLSPLNLKRIRASKPGGNWLDWPDELRASCHQKSSGLSYKSVYSRMRADVAAPTITTQFFNFGTGRFGHPEQDRAITPREAALLQSFPRDYRFVEDGAAVQYTTLGRMIGNAVPPKLGEAIGHTFIAHLKSVVKSRPNKRATKKVSPPKTTKAMTKGNWPFK